MGAPSTARRRPTKKQAAAQAPAQASEEVSLEALEAEMQAALADAGDDAPIGPDGEIRPVVIGKKGKTGPEMQHVFTVGEDAYYIPKNPSPAIMLKFLQEARDRRIGVDLAVSNAMLTLLGKDGLDALAESPDTDDEDVAKVFEIVAYTLFGAIRRWRRLAAPRRAG